MVICRGIDLHMMEHIKKCIYYYIMVQYTCMRCNHVTIYRKDHIKHLSRKHICDDINKSGISNEEAIHMLEDHSNKVKIHQCEDCNAEFPSRFKKYYHKKTVHGHRAKVNSCELVKFVAGNATQPITINIIQNQTISNNTNCNNTNTQNIVSQTTNAFGNESYQHLLDDKESMTSRFLSREGGWVKAAEDLYFDATHPENNNVRITNQKLPYAKTYDGKGSWKTEKQKKVLEDMIVTIKNMMDEHLDANEFEIRQATRNVPRLFDHAKSFLDVIKSVLDEEKTVSKDKLRAYKMCLESFKCMVLSNCSLLTTAM
jgi:hypothetical protein